MMTLFFLLLVGHALADYPLQGDFLARAKNHRAPIPGVPWQHGLLWHSVLHGGAVGLVTGSVWLGLLETAAHVWIDYAKSAGWFGWWVPREPLTAKGDRVQQRAFHIDQALHVLCKILWVILYTAGVR